MLRRDGQHATDEDAVGDDVEPGVSERRGLLRPQNVKDVTERRQNLQPDMGDGGNGDSCLRKRPRSDIPGNGEPYGEISLRWRRIYGSDPVTNE